jgi:flagellar assembly factor FliW
MPAAPPAPPATSSAARPAVVPSALLGPLAVAPGDHYEFAEGLYGFPGARAFVLVAAGRPGLCWLQSAEDAALAFLLADPFQFAPGYAPDVPDGDVAALGAGPGAAPVALYVVVTLPPPGGGEPTANLRAPVLLAAGAPGRGRQVVLPESAFGVREPLALG